MSRRRPPQSTHNPDFWLTLIDAFKITKDAAEALEKIPYVKAVAGVLAQVLEIREDIKKNNERSAALVDDVRNRSRGLINLLARYAEDAVNLGGSDLEKTLRPLEEGLRQYQALLEKIYMSLEDIKLSTHGFSGSLTRVFGRDTIKSTLESLREELVNFNLTFLVEQMSHIRLDMATQLSNTTQPSSLPARERVLVTPPSPSRLFIGRLEIRESMYVAFFSQDSSTGDQKCYVLHGLGGSGKTQLALKFINDNRSKFTRVYMIDASSIERIHTHLEDIGLEGGISSSPKPNDTLQWLSQLNENWLLLFDNADDPDIDLRPFLPRGTHGNIIITTRNPECTTHSSPSDASWHVSDLSLDEAIDLLSSSSRRFRKDGREIAEILVRELGYLALAIVQAGSFISKSPGLSFKEYLELFQTNRARLLLQGPKQRLDSYERTVYATWDLSFSKLTTLAQSFLQLCGFLHYDGIAVDIFRRAGLRLHNYPEEAEKPSQQAGVPFLKSFSTSDGDWDQMTYLSVTTELASYSLIQISEGIMTIHPLVHSWSRDRLPEEDRRSSQHLAFAILSLSTTFILDSVAAAHRRLLLPHIDAVLPNPLSEMDVASMVRFAGVYNLEGRYKKAVDLCRVVVARQKGQLDAPAFRNRQFLAQALSLNGDLGEAESLRVKLVDDTRRILGLEHPETLVSIGNLASTYHQQGRYEEAEPLQKEVLELGKRVFGLECPDTLTSMANLASTYRFQGRYGDAEPLENEVLEISKRVLGSEHPHTLASMANLASTYHAQGRHGDAEPLKMEVLGLRKQVLGSEHPDTLASMAGLASTFSAQGRYSAAETLEKEVLELRKRTLGFRHPETLRSMANLASTYSAQGKYSTAEPLEVEVLESRKRVLGLGHPDTCLSMVNLAITIGNQGRYAEAERLAGAGYDGYNRVLGPSHPVTLWSMNELASIHTMHGQTETADRLQTSHAALRARLEAANS